MFQGFYNLTSGIICQNRSLNVISNNMVNTSTPGYKKDTFLTSTFREELMSRTGNRNRDNSTALGETSKIRTGRETVTNYSQGGYDQTNSNLDFALTKDGFFQIDTGEGTVYTRNGSFIVDDEGFLTLQGVGRVIGEDGNIKLDTDMIEVAANGQIFDQNGTPLGKFALVNFDDYDQLTKEANGIFTTDVQGAPVDDVEVLWKTLERSNVTMVDEMTNMMSSQRALQSASQMLKIYDQIMGKAATDIARM